MKHADEMSCLLYLDGQLDPAHAAELVAHTGACAECRALLNALKRESLLLEESLQDESESVPARISAARPRESLTWAWAAAMGFASAGAYLLWTGVSDWQRQLAQAGFGATDLLSTLFFGGVFWEGWKDMITLVEVLAAVTLGGLALVLGAWKRRRWPALGAVFALLACLALPVPAEATEFSKAQREYRVARGETVSDDLVVRAGRVVIEGTVEGDLIVFTRSLSITGRVTGDVLGFVHTARIEGGPDGGVDGDIRIFANSLFLSAPVGKNVTAFLETAELDPAAEVAGSLMAFAKQVSVDGRVGRSMTVFAKHTYLNGSAGGLNVRGETLDIGATAEVRGPARFRGPKEPTVASGARLASPLDYRTVTRTPKYARPGFYLWRAVWLGAAFVLGLFLVVLAPGLFRDVVREVDRLGPSLGFGAVATIGIPILAGIVCVTVVGLAAGISALLLWAVAVYAAQVFVAAWIGEKLMGPAMGTGALVGRMAVGLALLHVVALIPIVGGVLKLLVAFLGMGALALAIYRRTRPQPLAPAPAV